MYITHYITETVLSIPTKISIISLLLWKLLLYFSYWSIVYFRSADTPFGQVKVGEITSWLGRRNKTPNAMVAAVSRAWWRWNHKYVLPKRGGIAPVFQLITGCMAIFYVINYGRISEFWLVIRRQLFANNSIIIFPSGNHRHYKYH